MATSCSSSLLALCTVWLCALFLTLSIDLAAAASNFQAHALSCDEEHESNNVAFSVASFKAAVAAQKWTESRDILMSGGSHAQVDPALCFDNKPATQKLLDVYFEGQHSFDPVVRTLLLNMLDHGLNPNIVPSGSQITPTPLARVLQVTPFDVALVRALLIAGHELVDPRLGPEVPTYLHLLPRVYNHVKRTVTERVAQGLYLVRHGKASSFEDAFQSLSLMEREAVQNCIATGPSEGCASAPQRDGDPLIVMDGLFEASTRFQDMDLEFLAFLRAVEAGTEDRRKINRHVGAVDASIVATETARTLLLLLLHSPHHRQMLSASQLLLRDPETGHNMIHAITAIGDLDVLGAFADALKSSLFDEIDQEEEPNSDSLDKSPALSQVPVQALRAALVATDTVFQRTPMHYAATMDAELVTAMRGLVAIAMGGDSLVVLGTTSEDIVAEQQGFPELYNLTDKLGETPGRYMKLYNTELREGDAAEAAPPVKSARELVEADEQRLTPSESEMVNRIVLKKRTLFARKALQKEENRLQAIRDQKPVGPIIDSHDDVMRAVNGPATMAMLKEREDIKNKAYIDYNDKDMVAQEIAAQEQRVATAQAKLDEYLAQDLLAELPKPAHMLDQNLDDEPKKLPASDRAKQEAQVQHTPIMPTELVGCDVLSLPFEDFVTEEIILSHLMLSEGPVAFRGAVPSEGKRSSGSGPYEQGWGAEHFFNAGFNHEPKADQCEEDASSATSTSTIDISALAARLRAGLLKLLHEEAISVVSQPPAIAKLPPALAQENDFYETTEADSTDFTATFLAPEAFRYSFGSRLLSLLLSVLHLSNC
eukprot:INCI16724.2.p1 GENE.INCI16724.2~~INCI16724.2.p1  ORF type:complete len:825 (+),score=154.29 INCI16724.2:105-2579(+)